MDVYVDYYATNSKSIVFRNNKKSIVTMDGVFKVDTDNSISYTPNPLYQEPIVIHMNAKLYPTQDKINKLYLHPHDIALRDEIIDDLTTNAGSLMAIIDFIKICPEYYNYFEDIVLNGNNSETIYDWMHYYHKLNDAAYRNALINSLHNKESISIHQILLCNVMNNSHKYREAKEFEKELKILALDLYDKDYFLENFKHLSNNCLAYDDVNNYDNTLMDDHKLVHESIINDFYTGLPGEYQLGVVI